MDMFKVMGLFAILPASILLTISFFILFVLRKTETQGLKVFGYVVAALLWLSALLVFSSGIYTISTGRPGIGCIMQRMMQGEMPGAMFKKRPGMPTQGDRHMRKTNQTAPMMKGPSDSSMMK